MSTPQRRLDWAGLLKALLFGAAALAGFLPGVWLGSSAAHPAPSPDAIERPVLDDELQPFVDRLGKPQYSSHEEELFVRDFFSDKRGGVFVDVGASHYRDRSNTYYLETVLGWSGIAVDPIVEFAADYRAHRPRTAFFPMFVSSKSDERASVYVGRNSLFSSGDRGFTDSFTAVERTITAPTITLDDLLTSQKIQRIDFLSIDIELHEPQALAGFNVERFKPALVCIEAHPPVRQQILDYFAGAGYVIVGKYMRADPQNLWFAPRQGS